MSESKHEMAGETGFSKVKFLHQKQRRTKNNPEWEPCIIQENTRQTASRHANRLRIHGTRRREPRYIDCTPERSALWTALQILVESCDIWL